MIFGEVDGKVGRLKRRPSPSALERNSRWRKRNSGATSHFHPVVLSAAGNG